MLMCVYFLISRSVYLSRIIVIILQLICVYMALFSFLCSDEVGFVHPDQFPALNEGPSSSLSPACILGQSADDILNKDTVELHVVHYDKKVFWNKDHKLAISILVLPQLYNAALNAYMDANRRYKQSIRSHINKGSFDDANCGGDFDQFLESEVLKHTRALLILSYDFKSAWNSRFFPFS